MLVNRIGWLVCVVYVTIPAFWLAIHPRAAYWRSQPHSPFRVLVPFWVGTWFALGVISSPWRNLLLYRTPWSWLPAVFLFGGACGSTGGPARASVPRNSAAFPN